MTWHTPITWSTDQPVTAILLNEQVRDNIAHLYSSLKAHVTLWHARSIVVTGNAIVRTVNTSAMFNGWALQSPALLNDEFTHSITLAAGTYRMNVMYRTGPDCGILRWLIGSTVLVDHNLYAAANTPNVQFAPFYVYVPTGGRFVLTGRTSSKDAASTGYAARIQHIWLERMIGQRTL